MNLSITLTDSGVVAQLNKLTAKLRNPRPVAVAVGREGVRQLKRHFIHKDRTEPNRLGGRRQHFWRKVSQSVQAPVISATASTVVISVTDARFAQKVHGGVIIAKRARMLTIPASREADGRNASTFEAETGLKLFLIRTGKGRFRNAVLATNRGGKQLQVEYVLTRSVRQAPDQTALPERGRFKAALLERARITVERLTAGT